MPRAWFCETDLFIQHTFLTRYSQFQRAVDRLCAHYAALGLVPPPAEDGIPPQRVIAILTSSAIDETILELALGKLGLTPLLLSVNNSVPAVAHLCKITNSSHLVYGSKFVSEAHEAQKVLQEQGIDIEIVPDKRFPLWGPGGVDDAKIDPFPPVLSPQDERDRMCVILHSSGSVRHTRLELIYELANIVWPLDWIPQAGLHIAHLNDSQHEWLRQ